MSTKINNKNCTEEINNNSDNWLNDIVDKYTGLTLAEILQSFNMYFLSYNGNTFNTRCQVPSVLRKKGLWITYVKYDGNVVIEWYSGDKLDDKSWGDSSNWRIGSNTLVGDITISSSGNWVINGIETEYKAIGEKGNTPLLRVSSNKLQVSYDSGNTYINVTNNPVYTKFRWNISSDNNTIGRIQASTDEGKTWINMSNDFTSNFSIKRYIGIDDPFPTNAVEGTIIAKGPYYNESDTAHTNPTYKLYVYAWKNNTLGWQDNGDFASVQVGITQEKGNSESMVMSQKAVTDTINNLCLQELGDSTQFPVSQKVVSYELNKLESRVIPLVVLYAVLPEDAPIGSYFINTGGVLKKKEQSGNVVVVPFENNMIFVYNNEIYTRKNGQIVRLNSEELKFLSEKIILLSGFNSIPPTPKVGQYYISVSGELREVTEVENGSIITYDVLPFRETTIYIYDNKLFQFNGTDLVEFDKELKDIVEKIRYSVIKVKSLYTQLRNPSVGDFYVSSSTGELREVTEVSGTSISNFKVIPADKNVLIEYNNVLYALRTAENNSSITRFSPVKESVVCLETFKKLPITPAVDTYYYSPSGKIRRIIGVQDNTITGWYELPISDKNIVYLYNNRTYISNGIDLVLSENEINEKVKSFDKKIVVLVGLKSYPSDIKLGDKYYTASKKIRTVESFAGLIPQGSTYEPAFGEIYIYNNSIYLWNGIDLVLAKAKDDMPERIMRVSSICLPNNLPSDNVVAPVLCAVKYDNSKNAKNGYGKHCHSLPIGWLYYDKANPNDIYYSGGVADRPKKLFTWKSDLSEGSANGISWYQPCICKNGDIIFVPRGERFNNRLNNPIIYKHDDYNNPIEIEVSANNAMGETIKPHAWFSNSGLEFITENNCFIFGEYTRPNTEPANIWKVTYPFDNPSNWKIVYGSNGKGEGVREVEHFHSINLDPFTNILYAVSGDEGSESWIFKSENSGDSWIKVYGGTEETRIYARAINMVFTSDYAYYGSDQANIMLRVGRTDGVLDFSKIERVVDANGTNVLWQEEDNITGEVYYTCLIDEPFGILLLSRKGGFDTEIRKPVNIYFYDIVRNLYYRIKQFPTTLQSNALNGFRCEAVNVYQSRIEKRIVCGFGLFANYNEMAGNNAGDTDYCNLALDIYE